MTESLLLRCAACGRYTLCASCPSCGSATHSPHPARFSPQDRWGRYRRALLAEVADRTPPGGVP
jgi:H/ACA ribonucleoprotein complex subunit 3